MTTERPGMMLALTSARDFCPLKEPSCLQLRLLVPVSVGRGTSSPMPYNRLYYFSSTVYCLKYEGISVHTFVPHLFLSRKCGILCTVFHFAFVYVTVYPGDVL